MVMAANASKRPTLWRCMFFSRDPLLPDEIKWLLHPSLNASYLRTDVMKKFIDLSLLGILEQLNDDHDMQCDDADNDDMQGNNNHNCSDKQNVSDKHCIHFPNLMI